MSSFSSRSNGCASKASVFFLTFFSYTMFHMARKSFSAIKGEMSNEEWLHSAVYSKDQQAQMYGLLDTLFMAFYATGLYISGILGDNYDLRKMIAIGMWCTAGVVLLFGLGAFANIHALSFYAVLWAANGLIQSCGWPANVAVMGKWFDKNERGAILGIWSGNGCFGNIVGTALVGIMFSIFENKVAWKIAMVAASVLVAFVGTLVYFFLVPDPKDNLYRHETIEEANPDIPPSIRSPSKKRDEKEMKKLPPSDSPDLKIEKKQDSSIQNQKGISFLEAWLIPGVIPYSLSYACLKSVNYALFFWLPFYLTVSLNMDNSTAAFFSVLYDVGQIFGGFAGGYLSDKMGVRSPVVVTMLILSCSAIYYLHGASKDLTAFLLVFSGFMLGGPASLISTAISADLGTHESIRGNAAALSTVTGIVDGTGSIGAALVQYLVGYLAQCHKEPADCDDNNPDCTEVCSWGPVFILLEIGTLVACLCLSRLLYHEILIIRDRRRKE